MKIQLKYKENYGNKHFYPICLYSHKLIKFKDNRKKCFTLDEVQYLKEKLFFEIDIKADTGI
tara:strand:+ start:289 stop:474 length:186 start_codon:yes stop_codon:yes gene_type:complete